MIKHEDDCVGCEIPCMGNGCPLKNVPHLYCDRCKEESDELYIFDGEELCIGCIIKNLEKVEV